MSRKKMPKTNLKKLVMDLGGLFPKTATPDDIDVDTLRLIACPFEAVEDPDTLEIEDCPSEIQCAACKRRWLGMEAH